MDIKELLARCDHTLLAVTAEESEIETLCDEAVKCVRVYTSVLCKKSLGLP